MKDTTQPHFRDHRVASARYLMRLLVPIFMGVTVVILYSGFALPESGKIGRCRSCSKIFEGYAVAESDRELRITFIMDRFVRPKVFTLNEPVRLVVDFQPAWTPGLPHLRNWSHPMLRGPIRTGWDKDLMRVRFVLDLMSELAYDVQQDLYLREGTLKEAARFVLTVKCGAS